MKGFDHVADAGKVALCGMAPLIADETTERWAEAVRLSSQSNYDRLLGSYHAADRLARELKAALDAARQEVMDLATRCADLENERDEALRRREEMANDTLLEQAQQHAIRCGEMAIERGDQILAVIVERDQLRRDYDELRRIGVRLPSELPPGLLPGAPKPGPEQRQDAIPAPAAQQGRPVSVEPAPALSLPATALSHGWATKRLPTDRT